MHENYAILVVVQDFKNAVTEPGPGNGTRLLNSRTGNELWNTGEWKYKWSADGGMMIRDMEQMSGVANWGQEEKIWELQVNNKYVAKKFTLT